MTVSLVVADHRSRILDGLIRFLSSDRNFRILAACRDGRACLNEIRDLRPDVALVDVCLPGLSGLEILTAAAAEKLSTHIVFLTASAEDRKLLLAAARGRYAVLPSECGQEALLSFLRRVAVDPSGVHTALPATERRRKDRRQEANAVENYLGILTARERQIAGLVSVGLSNKMVSRRLGVSEGTVKVHLHHIYQKLAINNRTALAALAIHACGNKPSAGCIAESPTAVQQ
jgi:two-component system nitrate/nitrite response regulator NarL